MGERELRLNSLSRYSKVSPQFVLEEHGHCEVPAGCGGVVLRWTNPQKGIPLELWITIRSEGEVYLDGTAPPSGRPIVEYGEHVLAFHVRNPDPQGVLMFAGVFDEEKMTDTRLSRKRGLKVSILSAADHTWKYTDKEPRDDSWMMPQFDDSGWRFMQHCDFPDPGEHGSDQYRLGKLSEFGATGLVTPGAVDWVWIRKVFSLPRN